MNKTKCGNANPKGNIALKYKGGCGKELDIKDAYRCVGCGGWFHKDCIIEHFKQEKSHDWGRKEERQEIFKLIDISIKIKKTKIKQKDIINDEVWKCVILGLKEAKQIIKLLE